MKKQLLFLLLVAIPAINANKNQTLKEQYIQKGIEEQNPDVANEFYFECIAGDRKFIEPDLRKFFNQIDAKSDCQRLAKKMKNEIQAASKNNKNNSKD